MAMSETKLLSCPHCGQAGFASVKRWPWEKEGEPGLVWGYHVICDASGVDTHPRGCGASSGWGETPESAIAAWNRRPSHEARIAELEEALRLSLPALEWCQKQWADSPQSGEGINVLDVVRAALAKAEARPQGSDQL